MHQEDQPEVIVGFMAMLIGIIIGWSLTVISGAKQPVTPSPPFEGHPDWPQGVGR
jgi:hypothetical protein